MNLKQFNFRSVALVLLFVAGGTNLGYAEFDGFEEERISLKSNQSFQNLKSKVSNYLVNSWCSAEKASMLMDLVFIEKPKVCVEIGVFTGSTLLPVAATLQYIGQGKVFAIDSWSNEEAVKNMSKGDLNREWWAQINMTEVFQVFSQMVQDWKFKPYCKVLNRTSESAVNEMGSIDFIHFDGNYSEKSSLQDVALYLPKVKKGGYILFSNVLLSADGIHPKTEALFALFDCCDIIAELENGNAYLLKKTE